MKRFLSRTSCGLLFTLAIMWGVGQIFRDVIWLTGICFYIPSPLLAACFLVAALIAFAKKRRRFAGLLLLLAMLPVGIICFRENSFWRSTDVNQANPNAQTLRLVHWNVFRGHLGWDKIQQTLATEQGDFYLLSEIPDGASLDDLTRLRAEPSSTTGNANQSQWFRIGSMAVWGRGSIDDLGWLIKSREAKVHLLDWHSPSGKLKILAVDLISDPFVPRDPLLKQIHALIETHQPDIIVGDFNAPRESLGLSRLPQGYRHAYWTAGTGWSYTWPVPVPMYALDQCFFGPRITPLDYRLNSSRLSDHRMQVFDFELQGNDDRMMNEE
ncbi:MAG: endonuclease/exonuclease/phosphatase family protein [Planctomycetaceae bacterium]